MIINICGLLPTSSPKILPIQCLIWRTVQQCLLAAPNKDYIMMATGNLVVDVRFLAQVSESQCVYLSDLNAAHQYHIVMATEYLVLGVQYLAQVRQRCTIARSSIIGTISKCA